MSIFGRHITLLRVCEEGCHCSYAHIREYNNSDWQENFCSTCLVERYNRQRQNCFEVFYGKTQLTALIWNLGLEEVIKLVYEKLGLVMTPALLKFLTATETQEEDG